jgi:hypothetical protein
LVICSIVAHQLEEWRGSLMSGSLPGREWLRGMNAMAIIAVDNLSKVFRVNQKDPGLRGALKALVRPRHVDKAALAGGADRPGFLAYLIEQRNYLPHAPRLGEFGALRRRGHVPRRDALRLEHGDFRV